MSRDSSGRLVADPARWTNSTLKAAADYAHAKGLLFGTYTDRGTQTCGGRPGAQGSEALDAQTYAEWGVEYVRRLKACLPALQMLSDRCTGVYRPHLPHLFPADPPSQLPQRGQLPRAWRPPQCIQAVRGHA